MRMRYSWDKDRHARTGVGTTTIFNAMNSDNRVARSILRGSVIKVRDRVLNSGDQALRKMHYGEEVVSY